MSLIAWLWVFTAFALVIAFAAIAICLSYRRRIESIVKDAFDVADLASEKVRLEAEIERCKKSLDENLEELRKIDADRQKQESLRKELAKDLQNIVSVNKQEVADLTAQKTGLQTETEQYKKSLDENREELRKIDEERQQQELLRKNLDLLSSQVVEEEKKRDEYRKEAEDLGLLMSEKAAQEMERGLSEEQLEYAKDAKLLVKPRIVKKHKLRF